MNLGDYQKEIEEELAKMKPGKKKRILEKMFNKFKDKKMLKVGTTMDNKEINKEKKKAEKLIKKAEKVVK